VHIKFLELPAVIPLNRRRQKKRKLLIGLFFRTLSANVTLSKVVDGKFPLEKGDFKKDLQQKRIEKGFCFIEKNLVKTNDGI